jgi:hypothetical protein
MSTENVVREMVKTTINHHPKEISEPAEIVVSRAMQRLDGVKHGEIAVIAAIKAAFKEGRELV